MLTIIAITSVGIALAGIVSVVAQVVRKPKVNVLTGKNLK